MKKQVFIITIMVVAALATACGQRASGRKNTMSTSKQKAVASPTKKEQKAVASPTKKEQEATASPTKKEQERASAVAKESLDEEDIHAALKVAKEYYKHTTQKVKSLEYNGGSGDQIQFQGKDTKSGKYRIIRLKKKNGKWVVKGEGY
ncbi:hypothetical protein [Clostridium sp. AM49-4BH]|uniref:hypothetical protein n=1 Tax=Clostridium sp. AM49-4BH TaxID=2293035 RepID=UPI0011C2325E|nr:hypothetical protein [Clostridium sp. AM49-4BH]